VERIQQLLNAHEQVYAFTDGSSLRNPGFSGAGVAFFGKPKQGSEDLVDSLQAFEDYTRQEG